MKVLITGGAGFIGSHLTDLLLKRGDQVYVIDNFTTGRRDNLQKNPRLTLIENTISDPKVVDEAFTEFSPDVVVHAAASYQNPDNWAEDVRTNIQGTANVVKAAEQAKIKRFIYFQTALCYGLKPIEQPITLAHPILSDGSSYAISKTAGEQYIRLSSLDYVSFRLANAYGPRNISGPLPVFYHRLTNGKPCFVMDTRRDFVYIDDLTAVVLKAIDGQGKKGAYHISSGRDYSIKELFDATLSALKINLDKEVEIRERNPDDAYTILLDPTNTERDFNWKVRTPLDVGVTQAIEYYRKFGIQQTFTHLRINENEVNTEDVA